MEYRAEHLGDKIIGFVPCAYCGKLKDLLSGLPCEYCNNTGNPKESKPIISLSNRCVTFPIRVLENELGIKLNPFQQSLILEMWNNKDTRMYQFTRQAGGTFALLAYAHLRAIMHSNTSICFITPSRSHIRTKPFRDSLGTPEAWNGRIQFPNGSAIDFLVGYRKDLICGRRFNIILIDNFEPEIIDESYIAKTIRPIFNIETGNVKNQLHILSYVEER